VNRIRKAARKGDRVAMSRLTPEGLRNLHEEMASFLAPRMKEDFTPGVPDYPYHLLVCGGTGCHATRSVEVMVRLRGEIEARGLQEKAMVIETGCNGFCAQGPVMTVYPGGIFYQYLKPEDALEIIHQHVLEGRPVERLMYHDPQSGKPVYRMREIPFFGLQELRVLRNRGVIAAERIEEYIGREGYQAACKALLEMSPGQIIKEVKDSGLRGRGGAGFPTGMKWEFASRSKGEVKYVLCNADEGDPGAFMDRSVLEADPHAVLEGMVIAAKAIGAHQGYIYCRAEYPLAVKRLTLAIEQARNYGLLGKDILGSGFDFDLEIYRGAGAFVCGEETALMTSIEGKRGMPRPRPPFPAVEGLWRKPTVLNNVETLASVPQIILKGARHYNSLGTLRSKGTKIFALTGDIVNVGLVEVPMGTPLGTIIYDITGGIRKGKRFKAAQLGGPSGGCIPAQHLNAPVDYESITQLGAIMGSGGMIVMDEDKCMVDVARFFMEFCQDESCGKCTPCRVGTQKMLEILTRICQGKGKEGDIETLERWAAIIQNTALCGLGQTAPNPVLSTLRYFRHEYEAHIREKRCPAVVCSALFKAPCIHTCPVEMDIPTYVTLARLGRLEEAYRVLLRTNPFPSVCGRVCDHKCELKCRRGTLDEPVHIKAIKRFITDHAPRPKVDRPPVTRKERIAVVGAGPSGLAAARELALRGYAVTVFEELPEAGGMLLWGIPEYRLPREVLRGEIQAILDLGVELRCNTRVGVDLSWEELKRGFDAIYLAVGAHRSMRLGLEGEDLQGVCGAVEFLRRVNLGDPPPVGERVVVIGGGNSAIDGARSALRLGARQVTILYRRLLSDMPAQEEEIRAAQEEGVRIQCLAAPARFLGQNGRLQGILCQRMALGDFDSSGRRRPVPVDGDEFTMDVDLAIVAIGQMPVLPFPADGDGIRVSRGGLIEPLAGSRARVSEALIFAGGDAVTGPDTVIGAIAAGKAAAREMDSAIRQRNGEPPFVEPREAEIQIPMEVLETPQGPRWVMPHLDPQQRMRDFSEVELGLPREVIVLETSRCMRCDIQVS
jgi:NADH-quinone oxidoreductase subunit F